MPISPEVYIAGMSNVNCVFVVDDDPAARNGLYRLLHAAGHDVRACNSAKQFLDALGSEVCGCVVLGWRMPGLSAKKLTEELTVRGLHLPIIVVTADDNPETRQEAKDMKAVGYFRKPVDGIALLDAVNWALRLNDIGSNHNKI